MGKRIELPLRYCHTCECNHPLGEHRKRKPKATAVVVYPLATSPEIRKATEKALAESFKQFPADGVALKSTAHPRGRKKAPADIDPAAVETVEAPASVVAMLDALGEKGLAKRKAENKKRKKADVLALVDAEEARKRALKNARQDRWRKKKRRLAEAKKRKAKK